MDFSRERIVEALVRETLLDQETAGLIGREVEEQIRAFHTRTLTAPLIRELVDAKLLEHGLEGARRLHTRLGMPLYDVEQLLLAPNKENANIPHGPEATNLTLAENIKKEYALLRVFSPEVADAHMRGDLHLHDLGFIDRPYCSGQSLEYVKKFGLNFPHALSIAKPARHPEVLLAHMVKFSAALQSHFAGAIGWDAVNVFFAPFLVGLPDREVRQLAQILIYEYSQQAVARGGQAIFSDINLYWETPKHFETVPAIGPGGEYTGKTYADYLPEAQRFVKALFEVYLGGRRRRAALLLPQAARAHHREALPDPRARGVPGPDLHGRRREGEHLLRLRPRRDREDLRVLPPLLQAREVGPRGRARALADALLGAAERDAEPAARGLRGGGGLDAAVRAPDRADGDGDPGPRREARLSRRGCSRWASAGRSRC